jgi:hypothetical protein
LLELLFVAQTTDKDVKDQRLERVKGAFDWIPVGG